MSSQTPTVFVCGATGTQGGAVARRLLDLKWSVHATVRDLSTPAAQKLQERGAKLTVGDWDNKEALTESLTGCSMAFLNFMPSMANMDHELVQAKGIISIALAVGVKHIIYSSGSSVGAAATLRMNPSSIATKSLISKDSIEKAVIAAGFDTWTILRGAMFMQNFLLPNVRMYIGFLETGVMTTAWKPDTRLPLVDTEDIAKFAAAAFQDPGRFGGQKISIFGEVLCPGDLTKGLAAVTGKDLRSAYLTEEEIAAQRPTNPFIDGQLMMRTMIEHVETDDPASWGVPLTTFDEFLQREKLALQEVFQ
jgi:uncharacterized protein YbjT (DUF2867 family)